MGIRETINEKPAVGVILVVALLVVAGVFIFWSLKSKRPPDDQSKPIQWYYDPSTQEIFQAELKMELPISRAPGGAVDCPKVYKYTCGDCEAGPFEYYLESYNTGPDGKSRKVVASWNAKDKWVDARSKEGENIQNAPSAKCREKNPGVPARMCLPKYK